MTKQYGWRDLISDVAIVAVLVGMVLLIIGSYPRVLEYLSL